MTHSLGVDAAATFRHGHPSKMLNMDSGVSFAASLDLSGVGELGRVFDARAPGGGNLAHVVTDDDLDHTDHIDHLQYILTCRYELLCWICT